MASAKNKPAAAAGKGSTVSLSSRALKQRLENQRQRGARAEMKRLDEEAQTHGFDNHKKMLEWVVSNRQGGTPPAPAAAAPQPAVPQAPAAPRSRAHGKRDRTLLAAQKRMERERKARLSEEKKRKGLQKQLEDRDVDFALRQAAWGAGITKAEDVDYAVHTIRRQLAGMNDEELTAFDENAAFTKLKEQRPYLGGERVQPANSGTGAGAAPPAPDAAGAQAAAGQEQQVDAKRMNRQEYAELLRQRGFTAPT